ncbi:MAG TPA: hypothetical protein VMV95_02540 [Bacillota bacterium]|nr:hypothetical protein [Bacillota bacterium]
MGQFLPNIRNIFGHIKQNKKNLEEKTKQEKNVQVFKTRMLKYKNPVEYVNNMYGCHPGEQGDYFDYVFGKK